MADLLTAPCRVCGSTANILCVKGPATYFRCHGCGFIFQHPLPTGDAFASYAEAEYQDGLYSEYVRARAMKLEHFRRRVEVLQGHCREGRLLDIGCSCGYFMEVAASAGFDVHGLEFSSSAIAAAAPNIRSKIRRARVEDIDDPSTSFDVVTAFDIIEHLNEPLEFLSNVRRLLTPGGLLMISTPDAAHWLRPLMGSRWPMLQPMQHVSLFTATALKGELERAGFHHIEIGPAFKVLSFDYLVGQLPTLNPLLHAVANGVNRVLPNSLTTQWRAVNIGEILAIATTR